MARIVAASGIGATSASGVSTGRAEETTALDAQVLRDFGNNIGAVLSSLLEIDGAAGPTAVTASTPTVGATRRRRLRRLVVSADSDVALAEGVPDLLLKLSSIILEGAVAQEAAREITSRVIGLSAARMTTSKAGGQSVAPATPTLGTTNGEAGAHAFGSFRLPGNLVDIVREQSATTLSTAATTDVDLDLDVIVTSYAVSPHPMRAATSSSSTHEGNESSVPAIPWSARGVQAIELSLPNGPVVKLQDLAETNLLVVYLHLPISTNYSGSNGAKQSEEVLKKWGWWEAGDSSPMTINKALDYCNFSLCINRLPANTTGQSAAEACGKTVATATTAWKTTKDISLGGGADNNTATIKRRCPDLCAFYDESQRGWAQRGCKAVAYHGPTNTLPHWNIECHCNHATSFSTALDDVGTRFEKRGEVLGSLDELSTLMILVFALSGGVLLVFVIAIMGGKGSESRRIQGEYTRYAKLGVSALSKHDSSLAEDNGVKDSEEMQCIFVPRYVDDCAGTTTGSTLCNGGAAAVSEEKSTSKTLEMVDMKSASVGVSFRTHESKVTSPTPPSEPLPSVDRRRSLTPGPQGRARKRRHSVLPRKLSFAIRKQVTDTATKGSQVVNTYGSAGAGRAKSEDDRRQTEVMVGDDTRERGSSAPERKRRSIHINLKDAETNEINVDDFLQSSDACDSSGRKMMRAQTSSGGAVRRKSPAHSSSAASLPDESKVPGANDDPASFSVGNPMFRQKSSRPDSERITRKAPRHMSSQNIVGTNGRDAKATFGFVFWRNLWENHYVLRMFGRTQDQWMTRTQRVAIVFCSVFCKMMVLSLLYGKVTIHL